MNLVRETEIIEIDELGNLTIRTSAEVLSPRMYHGMGLINYQGGPQVLVMFGGSDSSNNDHSTDFVEEWMGWTGVENWLKSHYRLKSPKHYFGFATIPTKLLCPDTIN